MINITIKSVKGKVNSIIVEGHSNSAPYGEDLVCAAVSAVVTGAFNSIESPKNYKLELKEGYAFLEAVKSISEHDSVVIETMITSLKTIEESNSRFIKIKNL